MAVTAATGFATCVLVSFAITLRTRLPSRREKLLVIRQKPIQRKALACGAKMKTEALSSINKSQSMKSLYNRISLSDKERKSNLRNIVST